MLEAGLGKTSITLTAINDMIYDSFEIKKVLIVAPLRVAKYVWTQEIQKWDHLHRLTYSIIVGTPVERNKALMQKTDIHIINRENIEWYTSNYLAQYDLIVVDELSSFKNHQSKRWKALMKMRARGSPIVWGLTATPASNSLMDLWSEFRLLDLGKRLGRYIGAYRSLYFIPDRRNQMMIFNYKPKDSAENEIYSKVSDITISMKNRDYLNLPDLVKTRFNVEMSQTETELYERLKRDMILTEYKEDISAVNAASLSGKLLQMAGGEI
jgi:SNF2 family DNA or RNA helicase